MMANTAEKDNQKLADNMASGSSNKITAALQIAHCQGKKSPLRQWSKTQIVRPIIALVAGIPHPDKAA